MSWPVKNSRGFTLVEVLVAITIMAIGLVSVIEAMTRTQQALRISKNLVTASMIAEEQITASQMEVRQSHRLRPSQDDGRQKFPGREFQWSRTVEKFYDDSMEDETKLNRVQVRVMWNEGPDRSNELQLGTLILNREKQQ